jgi:hypothetical protein
MQTKTILVAVLAVLSVVLAGVLGYQKLTQPELSSALPETSPIVINQPGANMACVKQGENDMRGAGIKAGICCPGLTPIKSGLSSKPLPEGGCSGVGSDSYVCMPCGNSVCDTGENKCNCPQDCAIKLTLDVLSNAEYYSSNTLPGLRIKLVNGTYQEKPPLEGLTKLETNYIVYGDLNNDGQEDAVVVLATSAGGTGLFRELEAVLNQNGKAFNVAMQDLGDRPIIYSITIESGIIIIDLTLWEGGRAGVRTVVKYKLSGDKLQEVNVEYKSSGDKL